MQPPKVAPAALEVPAKHEVHAVACDTFPGATPDALYPAAQLMQPLLQPPPSLQSVSRPSTGLNLPTAQAVQSEAWSEPAFADVPAGQSMHPAATALA